MSTSVKWALVLIVGALVAILLFRCQSPPAGRDRSTEMSRTLRTFDPAKMTRPPGACDGLAGWHALGTAIPQSCKTIPVHQRPAALIHCDEHTDGALLQASPNPDLMFAIDCSLNTDREHSEYMESRRMTGAARARGQGD